MTNREKKQMLREDQRKADHPKPMQRLILRGWPLCPELLRQSVVTPRLGDR